MHYQTLKWSHCDLMIGAEEGCGAEAQEVCQHQEGSEATLLDGYVLTLLHPPTPQRLSPPAPTEVPRTFSSSDRQSSGFQMPQVSNFLFCCSGDHQASRAHQKESAEVEALEAQIRALLQDNEDRRDAFNKVKKERSEKFSELEEAVSTTTTTTTLVVVVT